MKTLREFIGEDPLGAADAESKRSEGSVFFGNYLPSTIDPLWLRVLSKFSNDIPLRYWDKEIIEKALAVLEKDNHRTLDALSAWKNRVGIGFDYLFRRASIEKYEEDLSISNASDLLSLANEFHPEYLRRCEHILTNLIILYWAVLKKGSVNGNFDITRAFSIFKSKGCELLMSGYDDKVRNGIAHGQVIFGSFDIQYGDIHFPYRLQDEEFLYLFDTLWRTSNSLAIAVLLFLARNLDLFPSASNILPTGIIALVAAAETERRGLSITGVVESEGLLGSQLHVLTKTSFRKHEAVLFECAHIALRLLDAGAIGYSRFVFEIDQGTKINSMIAILPNKLAGLQNESYERFLEILDSPLIWTNESTIQNQIKAFKIALLSNAKLVWMKFISEQQSKGLFQTTNRYFIKRVKNSSAGGMARLHIFITLRFPSDENNREMIRKIISAVIRKYRKKRFAINPSKLLKRWNWHKRPTYIWVSLYRLEGPARWVVYGGWLKKNLITQAERVYSSKAQPVFVKKPDEMWMGIRLQYSIDIEAAARSFAEILKLANEINSKRKAQQ
jgi:hypothetical protein